MEMEEIKMTSLTMTNEKLIDYILKNSKTVVYKNYKTGDVIREQGDKIVRIGLVISGVLQMINYTYQGGRKLHEYSKPYSIIPIYQYLAGINE